VKNTNKREEIVRAALELIAERGFHGTPMAMIAKKAGVGAGTIYRYFESKDVLISKLYRELEKHVMAALEEGYSTEKPFRERFLHIGTILLKYFIAYPLQFRYIEQYHNSPYGVSLRRDMIMGGTDKPDIFNDLVEQGIAQQVLKDLPLFIHFALAFGPLIALARDHALGLVILDDIIILRTVEACWDSVKR
jgi:AcrR family transcriptional regulator